MQHCYTVHSDKTCLSLHNSVSEHTDKHNEQIKASKHLLFITAQSDKSHHHLLTYRQEGQSSKNTRVAQQWPLFKKIS